MKVRTFYITEGYGMHDTVAILDGPSTADLSTLRLAFRDQYGFPTFPSVASSVSSEELTRINVEHDMARERAAADLHEPSDLRTPYEAALFTRWLKRDHGFTDRPFTTFHYDDEDED